MALPPDLWPVTLAGGLNLVLGAALMVLNFNHRANRAFATVMLLRAGTHLHFALAAISSPVDALAWQRSAVVYGFWIEVALLYFLAVYPAPREWLPPGLPGRLIFLVPAVLGSALFVAFPAAFDPGAPAYLFVFLGGSVVFAVAALVLARDTLRMEEGLARTSTLLIAAGFAAVAGQDLLGAVLSGALQPALRPHASLVALGVGWALLELALLALLVRHLRAKGARLMLAALAVGAGLAVAGATLSVSWPGATTGRTITAGLVRLVLPALVAYALLRYRVFDLDVRFRRSFGRTLVVGAFVLMFFAGSEAAERVVSDRLGALFGVGAALLMLLVVRPLERAASGFAQRLFPFARDPTTLDEEARVELYRELARTAWLNGEPSEGAQRVLAAARERLRIPAPMAAGVEREAAATLPARL